MKSAAFFPICRRLCIGVAHRGRHASGFEHLCTTRPSGFRASLRRLGSWSVAGDTRAVSNTSVLLVRAVSSTSVLLVRAVSQPPSLRRLGSWSVAGVTRAVSNTSVLLVRAVSEPPALHRLGSCSVAVRHASGLEHLCTTRPSGSTARCGRRASGLGQRCTTPSERFRPPSAACQRVPLSRTRLLTGDTLLIPSGPRRLAVREKPRGIASAEQRPKRETPRAPSPSVATARGVSRQPFPRSIGQLAVRNNPSCGPSPATGSPRRSNTTGISSTLLLPGHSVLQRVRLGPRRNPTRAWI